MRSCWGMIFIGRETNGLLITSSMGAVECRHPITVMMSQIVILYFRHTKMSYQSIDDPSIHDMQLPTPPPPPLHLPEVSTFFVVTSTNLSSSLHAPRDRDFLEGRSVGRKGY